MEEVKKVLRYGVITMSTLFVLYCIYRFVQNDFQVRKQEKHCGKIVSKSNDEIAIKYGSSTRLFLNVNFGDVFRSVEVEPTTYFKFEVGESICINETIETDLYISLGFLFLMIVIILPICCFIIWLFDIKFNL